MARFVGPEDVGDLRVRFFWPLSGAYRIVDLDRDGYNYAMVTSSGRAYLWILAREKRLDAAIQNDLLARAKDWGFRTEDLIFVEQ